MDLAHFEILERRIKSLAESFHQTRAENQQLRQQVDRLQHTVAAQQETLERVQRERDDLGQASEALSGLGQEREVIQEKHRHMLATIEWLEKHTAKSGESQSG
jgi:predicted nuclease with TOPRIM domain